MSRARLSRSAFLLAILATSALGVLACDRRPKDDAEASEPRPAVISSARDVVPPVSPLNATPVSEFADAGNLDGQPPYERARAFHAEGQLWMARLVLERKALGSDATKPETELLARICQDQADVACVDACAKKLGRKIKMPDGGAPQHDPKAKPK